MKVHHLHAAGHNVTHELHRQLSLRAVGDGKCRAVLLHHADGPDIFWVDLEFVGKNRDQSHKLRLPCVAFENNAENWDWLGAHVQFALEDLKARGQLIDKMPAPRR